MRRLHFVGDGPRDERILPPLVRGLLKATFDTSFTAWARLHGGGFERKLAFAATQARDLDSDGLAAVVDEDGTGITRLKSLRNGREKTQAKTMFPIAIGCAIRHMEAWLLDDERAVRSSLELDSSAPVPFDHDAKAILHRLWIESPRHAAHVEESELNVLSEIAAAVDELRCNRRIQTGLEDFADDVRRELGPLF